MGKKDEQKGMIHSLENLDDCFKWLKKSIVDYKKFGKMKEKKAIVLAHHGVGRFIRNKLELWSEYQKKKENRSPLVNWFNNKGIYHPDDISGIILTSFHRYLNGKKLKIKNQIKKYRDYWKKENPKINEGFVE